MSKTKKEDSIWMGGPLFLRGSETQSRMIRTEWAEERRLEGPITECRRAKGGCCRGGCRRG